MIELPKTDITISVDVKGDTTGLRWQGEFTVVAVPTLAQRHRYELERSRLMADLKNPTPSLQAMSEVMATVNTRILKAPDWWKQAYDGIELLDHNIAVAIYDQILDAEETWREQLQTKQTAASPETSSKKDDEKPAK